MTDLRDSKENEKKEFDEVKTSFESVLSQWQQQINELEKQKQALESDYKEITIMINMATPQNEEVRAISLHNT